VERQANAQPVPAWVRDILIAYVVADARIEVRVSGDDHLDVVIGSFRT
jgi:hypothetical protein